MSLIRYIRGRLGPLLAGLVVVLGLLLWLAPAEQTLGQVVKLVYLHGALVRVSIILFALSLPVNLLGLVTGRAGWLAWGQAIIWAAVAMWLVHTGISMITTYATWGVFIAWFEPRTRFTFNLAAVSLVVTGVAWLVNHSRFSGLVFVLLAGLVLGLLPGLGFVQHPVDPIGLSPSNEIRVFYTAILLVLLAIGGGLVLWLQARVSPQ